MSTKTALQEHLIEMEDALKFMLAGYASFTFRSQKTGTRYTYKIIKGTRKGTFMCMLLVGPTNYRTFGWIHSQLVGYTFELTPTYADMKAPSVQAFNWVFKRLVEKRNINFLEIWHEGRCGKCGRPLTDPESIKSGIGPYCASKM